MRLVTLAALSLVGACVAPEVAVEPRLALVDVQGDFGISSGSISATNDVDALGIEKDDSALGVRADLKWTSPHLTVDLQQSTHDGDGVPGLTGRVGRQALIAAIQKGIAAGAIDPARPLTVAFTVEGAWFGEDAITVLAK